jgi:ferredoxin
MKRWKTVIVALISLWLPLQGYGAIAMPFCQQHGMAAAGTGLADTSQEHHDAHPGHMAHNDSPSDAAGISHAEHASSDAASGLACNNCGACHLACSPAISAIAPIAVLIGDSVLESAPADSPHFFYPEQLQRPPLSALL